MTLSPPFTAAALAAVKKRPSIGEQRAFAAGIMAHLAIQTFYRLEHSGHFIITERLVTIGDGPLATLSRFPELTRRGSTLAKLAQKVVGKKNFGPLVQNDLYSVLAYLLDSATDLSSKTKRSKKRFDILDFGPIVTSAVPPLIFAQGYEIKSVNGFEQGRDYIKTQTDNFNITLSTLRDVLQGLFDVKGLFNMGAMPGKQWPTIPHLLPIGPNVLMFYYAGNGVICYEWQQFKRLPIRALWRQLKEVADKVRELFKRESRLDDDIRNAGLAFAAIAVVAAAMVLWELIAAEVVLEGVGAVSIAAMRALTALASRAGPVLGPVLVSETAFADTKNKAVNVDKALSAIEAANNENISIDPSQFELADPNGERSGGTGPTVGKKMVDNLANTLADQFIFRYAVVVGQGSDLLDDTGRQVAKESVREALGPWLKRYLSSYGLEAFLNTFGEEKLDEDTAFKIADILITAGTVGLKPDACGSMLMHLAALNDEDVSESLPENSDDSGETM
jgi:hypothetical protein